MTANQLFSPVYPSYRPTRRRAGLVACAVAAALCATPAIAQVQPGENRLARPTEGFSPYVALGAAYDSNIYRLDEDAPEIGDSLSDTYGTLAAGFESSIEKALQRYELSAEVSQTVFTEHDELDYTGSKARAVWHWVASQGAKGDLGLRHRRSLRDFANQVTLDRFKDLRMENAAFGSGRFSLPGRLSLGLRGEFADVSFSETDRLDLQRTMVGGDLGISSRSGSLLAVDAEYLMGRYDNNAGSDFDEYTVGPKAEWKVGARTSLEARAGYTARDYDEPSRNDYDGVTGEAVLILKDDGRNEMRASVYRVLSNLGDEIADYAVVNGIKIEPAFHVRENLDLRIMAGYEKRDFNRDPQQDGSPPPIILDRTDDVYTAGAFVDWKIGRHITLSFGADMQRRDSTRELQDYDFGRFQVQITGRL